MTGARPSCRGLASERCPKCGGAGDVHRTLQHVSAPSYEVIGGKRVTCTACGGSGTVRVPVQAGNR
jgi:DnaJ-class molecular chaperone